MLPDDFYRQERIRTVRNSFFILTGFSLVWAVLLAILPWGVLTTIVNILFAILTLGLGGSFKVALTQVGFGSGASWVIALGMLFLTVVLLRSVLLQIFGVN